MTRLKILLFVAHLFGTGYPDSAFLRGLENVIRYATDGQLEWEAPELHGDVGTDIWWETFGHPTVSTTSGEVIGSILLEATAFFSVPYATPPIGELRFRDTVPVVKISDLINATNPDRVVCRQHPRNECLAGYCTVNQKEDCLVLNVFVPRSVDLTSKSPADRLPVMLWIHGGAFSVGTGTAPYIDGRWLSNATDSIVVTINYRLGPYGFLVYNRGDDHLNGNQGLKDQQMAMRWVQENIEGFGGDKNKVMIFGESAGAQSVMWHTLSNVSRPLYRRAILQSNAAIVPHQTTEEAMEVTERLLAQLNCSSENEFECLFNASADDLDRIQLMMAHSISERDAWGGIEPYRPVIDGVEFTDQPLALFQAGKWNTDREYIVGANTQEAEILQFYVPGDRGLSKINFRLINTMLLGKEVGTKAAEYYEERIGPDGNDYSKILGIEAGDAFFICPSRAMSRFAYESADNPDGLYFYMFDHAPDGEYCHAVYPKNETCGYVYHSAEIQYVFRSGPGFGYVFNDDEIIVADQLSKYWGNFARNGDPNNSSGSPVFSNFAYWPPYVKTTSCLPESAAAAPWTNIHILPPDPCKEDRYKEDICDFWDSLDFYVTMQPRATTTQSTTEEGKPVPCESTEATETSTAEPPTLIASPDTTSGSGCFRFSWLFLIFFLSSGAVLLAGL